MPQICECNTWYTDYDSKAKIRSPTKAHREWFGYWELQARRSLDKRQELIGWPYSRRRERRRGGVSQGVKQRAPHKEEEIEKR